MFWTEQSDVHVVDELNHIINRHFLKMLYNTPTSYTQSPQSQLPTNQPAPPSEYINIKYLFLLPIYTTITQLFSH